MDTQGKNIKFNIKNKILLKKCPLMTRIGLGFFSELAHTYSQIANLRTTTQRYGEQSFPAPIIWILSRSKHSMH